MIRSRTARAFRSTQVRTPVPGFLGYATRAALCIPALLPPGGIGLSIHNIRATNSYIRGTNGESNGIVPMLRVFADTARYVDQGGGKRKGGFAIYLEPWHADIFEFIDLKKNTGKLVGLCFA
jgi:hypothetical protein